jgi:hypothetical protein
LTGQPSVSGAWHSLQLNANSGTIDNDGAATQNKNGASHPGIFQTGTLLLGAGGAVAVKAVSWVQPTSRPVSFRPATCNGWVALDEAATCATEAAVIASGVQPLGTEFRTETVQKAGLWSPTVDDSHRSEGGGPYPQRRCLGQNAFRTSRNGKVTFYALLTAVPCPNHGGSPI